MQSPSVPERFRPLLAATAELAERFGRAGRTLYLVGGSVRDALFPAEAETTHDFDLTTSGRLASLAAAAVLGHTGARPGVSFQQLTEQFTV